MDVPNADKLSSVLDKGGNPREGVSLTWYIKFVSKNSHKAVLWGA